MELDADGTMIISGPQGITGTPRDATFLIGIILVLITLFIVINLTNSRSGRAIMSIRDNRIAAESIGINVTKYKLMAFTVSAALAGSAGVLCICCSRRNRKYQRFHDCGGNPHTSSGAASRPV